MTRQNYIPWGDNNIMKKAALIAGALLLAGCAGSADSTETVPATASASMATQSESSAPTPTPSPSTPTVNEIAAVIAQHEADWRDTMERAFDCRTDMVLAEEDDALAQASVFACLTREATMTLTAGSVTDKLAGKGAPAEVYDLTDETIRTLALIEQADVQGQCMAVEGQENSDECTAALGAAWAQYSKLESLLDGWRVYIN